MKRIYLLALLALLISGVTASLLTAQPAVSPEAAAPQTLFLNWEGVIPTLPTRLVRSPQYAANHTLYVTTDRDLRRTVDEGDTWHVLYPPAPVTEAPGVTAMAVDPGTAVNPTLFVTQMVGVDSAEIHRSVTDGASWTPVFTSTVPIHDLAAARDAAGNLIVFATAGGNRLWRSADGGDNWTAIGGGLPAWADVWRLFISPTFAADGALYATGFGPLLRSVDGGDTWAPVAIPWVDIARHVVFSPDYAADGTLWVSYFFVEGSGDDELPPNGIVRSTDYGATWTQINAGLPVDYLDGAVMGIAPSPDYSVDPVVYTVERALQPDGTAWQLYRTHGDAAWIAQGLAPDATPTGLVATTPSTLFLPTQAGLWRLRTGCWETIANGDCERNAAWEMATTPAPAAYSFDQAHGGARSIRVGIIDGPNRYAYSSARQMVALPATPEEATLTFWLYPASTATRVAATSAALPADRPATTPTAGDAQYVLILDQWGNILERLVWMVDDSRVWREYTFDVSEYIGRSIQLLFGVFNDGVDGVTGMYVDDISLTACAPLPEPPASQVDPLPSVQTGTAFTVTWRGNAAVTGYDVQVRDGDADTPWSDWLVNTPATAAVFDGADGHTYTFRSRGRNAAGELEPWPANKWQDTFTTVLLTPAPVLITSDKVAQPLDVMPGDGMEFQIHAANACV